MEGIIIISIVFIFFFGIFQKHTWSMLAIIYTGIFIVFKFISLFAVFETTRVFIRMMKEIIMNVIPFFIIIIISMFVYLEIMFVSSYLNEYDEED